MFSVYIFHQLISAAVKCRFNSRVTRSSSFLEKLIVLHLVYQESEKQLQQFKQLVSLSPSIVTSVMEEYQTENKKDFKEEISVSYCF